MYELEKEIAGKYNKIIRDKIKIVDEISGRILEGRRYGDGLHQAIEAFAFRDVPLKGNLLLDPLPLERCCLRWGASRSGSGSGALGSYPTKRSAGCVQAPKLSRHHCALLSPASAAGKVHLEIESISVATPQASAGGSSETSILV